MLLGDMANVVRIAFDKMLVLLRLVIVASLAAYSLPTVSFAMHGDASSSYPSASDRQAVAADHAATEMDHHDHGKADQSADRDSKPIKQDCCSDFCLSMAIVAEGHVLASTTPSSVRSFYNDHTVFGELSSLHRPPSFRT